MMSGICSVIVQDERSGWGCGGSSIGHGLRDVGAELWVHEGQCTILFKILHNNNIKQNHLKNL